ncbi:serine hydrolase [Roseomonas sp. KE0001]|uniref:serine hydrolase domain-containing protein n=1 Tax=Roseomonas sp. KE0001 TaxID=2479201 RepID=UPI0018DF5DC7|nr:serine hydrolase domain-containing protein [Roseomonas sp. KE0001]MBI0433189.1 class A beta-lactamase-related serine hydrolase [Roseomonas sp. KE0001]
MSPPFPIRRRLVTALLPLAALALSSCASPTAPPASRQAVLDAALREQVQSGKVGAIAALVLREDGTVLYSGSAGETAPGNGTPPAPDSLFRLASMTKPFTSVAVMQLVEQGRIGLDDPVGRWLPEFRNLRVRAPQAGGQTGGPAGTAARDRTVPAARQPTVRDLLRHTSGLSYTFLNVPGVVEAYRRLGVDDGLAAPGRALDDNMRRLARAPLAMQPGSGWHYSLATDVLGAIVTRASGEPLDAYVARHIATPLGLGSFAFHVPESARPRMVTALYPDAAGTLRPMASPQVVPYPLSGGTWTADPNRAFSAAAYPSGGAGATATIGDYGRFARMLLRGGELDGARILKPETVAEMTRPQTGAYPIDLRGPGYAFGYGFSVLTDPVAGKTRQGPGTYGWGGIYGTGFFVDPAHRIVTVVMTQTGVNGGPAANAVREAVYGTLEAAGE